MNARPLQVFGPQELAPTRLSNEDFSLLFFGGMSASQASGFFYERRGTSMDTPLALEPSIVGVEPGILRVVHELSPPDISFLVHYLKSKAHACSGGRASTSPISTWFRVGVISNQFFTYRLSSQGVQPPDLVTAKLFALVGEEVNRAITLPIPFRVDAVQAHMLPACYNLGNVPVQFPFVDDTCKDSFFLDTVRALLFVFEAPQETPAPEEAHPPAEAVVPAEFDDLMAQAAAAVEPSQVASEPASDSTFRIPRVFSAVDTALDMEVKFQGAQKILVGNGRLLVLTGDIAASHIRLHKMKSHMGFRGVFVFHQFDMNTLIRTNRNLKRYAMDQPSV